MARYCQLIREQNPNTQSFSKADVVNRVVDDLIASYAQLDFRLKGPVLLPRLSVYNKVHRLWFERGRKVLNGVAAKKAKEKYMMETAEFFDILSCR